MRTLACGCVVEGIFPALCPEARKLQAQLAQALGERDRPGARVLRGRLAAHREETPIEDDYAEHVADAPFYVAESPVALLSKASAP